MKRRKLWNCFLPKRTEVLSSVKVKNALRLVLWKITHEDNRKKGTITLINRKKSGLKSLLFHRCAKKFECS